MSDDKEMLAIERNTFESKRDELLAHAEGEFVLIHGSEVSGTYRDELDAIGEGYKKFGNVPFLVKRISQVEAPANFVSNNLGV